jgi:hypothetical protein
MVILLSGYGFVPCAIIGFDSGEARQFARVGNVSADAGFRASLIAYRAAQLRSYRNPGAW